MKQRRIDTGRSEAMAAAAAAILMVSAAAFAVGDHAMTRPQASSDGKLGPDEYMKARSIYESTLLSAHGRDSLITGRVKAALLRDSSVSGIGAGVGVTTDGGGAERAAGQVSSPGEAS